MIAKLREEVEGYTFCVSKATGGAKMAPYLPVLDPDRKRDIDHFVDSEVGLEVLAWAVAGAGWWDPDETSSKFWSKIATLIKKKSISDKNLVEPFCQGHGRANSDIGAFEFRTSIHTSQYAFVDTYFPILSQNFYRFSYY